MAKTAFGKIAKAKEPAKAKKEKHEFTDPKLEKYVEQWVDAKSRKDQAEQDIAEAEAEILPRSEEERIKASQAEGANQSTVVVNGKLAISQNKRFRNITAEALAELQKTFGSDSDRFFRTRTEVKVKESILENEELAAQLTAAIGEENLAKFFDVTETVVASEAFHVERSTNPECSKKAKTCIDQGLITPYKATVKLA